MSNLKAVLTFDESWDDEAVRNAFADNDQFPGVTVAEVASTECGGCARHGKGCADQQSASPTNIDYTAALTDALDAFFEEHSEDLVSQQYINMVAAHLNTALQKQYCA